MKIYFIIACVILLLVSCSGRKSNQLTDNDKDIVEVYLAENILQPSFGGTVYCAIHIFDSDFEKIYLWANAQEYYKEKGVLSTGSGWSVPLVVHYQRENNILKVNSFQAPRDGELYNKDIISMFPAALQKLIFDFPSTKENIALGEKLKKRAAL